MKEVLVSSKRIWQMNSIYHPWIWPSNLLRRSRIARLHRYVEPQKTPSLGGSFGWDAQLPILESLICRLWILRTAVYATHREAFRTRVRRCFWYIYAIRLYKGFFDITFKCLSVSVYVPPRRSGVETAVRPADVQCSVNILILVVPRHQYMIRDDRHMMLYTYLYLRGQL